MEFSPSFIAAVDAVGTALLHFFWQGAVLALIYAALRPWCTSISARYRLGFGTLLAMAMCPLVTLLFVWPADGESAGAFGPLLSDTINAVADRASASPRDYLPALVALWTCGVVAIASRSLWHWQRIQRLVRHASAPGPEWQLRLQRMCARFGLRRPVRLLVSAKVVTPMLIGWLKPVVLLPLSMLSGFDPQQIELIIAHELGHVRRWDYLANVVQVIVETVLFYHPAVHWISRDVRNARESCCDDLVLSLAQGNPLTYARALADLEEMRQDLDVVAPALGATGGVLLARIRRIVGVEGHDPLPRNATWPVLLVLAAMVCFAVRPRDASMPELISALARVPVESLAIMSGNPRLIVAPYKAPRLSMNAPPLTLQTDPALAPSSVPVADTTASAVTIGVDRPRIDTLAAAPQPAAVRDLLAARAAPLPSPPIAADLYGAPARLQMVAPVYPPRAMSAGVEGNVELEYSVGTDGSPGNVRVIRAQPEGVFDAAAISALAQWRFQGGNGASRYVQNFAFTLHKEPGTASKEKCQQVIGSLICRQFDE